MKKRFRVSVTKRKKRGFVLRAYDDGQYLRERKSDASRRDAAARDARDWEYQLNHSGAVDPVSWVEFRAKYEAEVLSGLSEAKRVQWRTVCHHLDELCPVARVDRITGSTVSTFAAKLRTRVAETSVKAYLDHLRPALTWAADMRFIDSVPPFPKIRRAKTGKAARRMKGRPLTVEEFERLLAFAPLAVGERWARSWRLLLRGLFLSGLRIGEAMDLSWPDGRGKLRIEGIDLPRPMLRIQPEGEKGFRDRTLPITPDFAELLRRDIPLDDRTGYVFRPLTTRGERAAAGTAEKRLATIGRRAKVCVSLSNEPLKFATAHDLRRSFGTRWAPRVMPAVLQQLMRHDSIETTMRYYVGIQAGELADRIYSSE